MEIKRIPPSDYEELLSLLDICFLEKTGISYKNLLPKYFLTYSDENLHLGLYQEGKLIGAAGLYENQLISPYGQAKTGCIGAVCVHPSYRGRGFFKLLMNKVIEEARQKGLVFIYLTGSEKRYAHFGFYPAGRKITALIKKKEVIRDETITAVPISKDSDSLKDCQRLYGISPFRLERNKAYDPNWFYNVLCSWYCKPFTVYKNNKFVGYFTKRKDNAVFECLWEDGYQKDVLGAAMGDDKKIWVGLASPIKGHKCEIGYSALVKILDLEKTEDYLGSSLDTKDLNEEETVKQLFNDWFIQTCDLG